MKRRRASLLHVLVAWNTLHERFRTDSGVAMSYDVRVTAHDRYLRIEASGTRSPEASRAFFRRIAEESAAHGLYDILLVLKLEGRLSTFEIHDLIAKHRESGFDERHRIAVVDQNPESRPDMSFAEDVGVVRGLQGAAFDNEEDAIRWLLERPGIGDPSSKPRS